MKSKIDKFLEIITSLVLIGLIFGGIYIYYDWFKENEFNRNIEIDEISLVKEIEEKLSLPEEINLEIPFTSQAPFGDWSYPFNHTCEEAAVLMVYYYLEGKTVIDPVLAKKELLDLVEYEKENYGFHEDSSVEQIAQLIRDYYNYKTEILYNISLEDIKKELVQGNPVIVPTTGKSLGNLYFTPPGPIYHMLVLKGYNLNGFIANDPGTKRGADYLYPYQILMKSIHDWNNGDVENGKVVIISIQK